MQGKSRSGMKRGGNLPSAYKIWAIDWLQLEFADGTLAWGLVIVDVHSRECTALRVLGRPTATSVIAVLREIVDRYGLPREIWFDHGFDFTSPEIDHWADAHGVTLLVSPPLAPWRKGLTEAVCARFSADWREQMPMNRDHAQTRAEAWRLYYNRASIQTGGRT
jgi:putative transposase